MRSLGLDPSLTNFGWALHDPVGEGSLRCVDRGRFKTSSKDLFISRYIELRENLRSLIQKTNPDWICCEYPIFNDLYSEGMYGLFLFTCEAIHLEKKDVVFFSPGQLKAHARDFISRPKGWNMKKMDMVEAAKRDTGGSGKWSHHEADAYWAARSGARFWLLLNGKLSLDSLTANERKQFTKIHTFTRGKKAGKTEHRGIIFRENKRFFRWSQKEVNGKEI